MARFLIGMAVQLLPAGACRDRYRREFLAELTGMRPARQVLHGLALVATAPALRAAVISASHAGVTGVAVTDVRPAWRCRVRLSHAWAAQRTEDGERYLRCTRCGTDLGVYAGSSAGWAYLGSINRGI